MFKFLQIVAVVLPLLLARSVADEPVPVTPPPNTDAPLPVTSIEVTDTDGQAITDEAAVGQMLIVSSRGAVHAGVPGSLNWIVRPQLQTFSAGGDLVINTGLSPCTLTIMQIVSTQQGSNTWQEVSIRIGKAPGPPPGPDGPIVPEPDPEPEPEPPVPTGPSLKVLIVEESGQRHKLPESQKSVLFSPVVREYLKSHCTKSDGSNPDFRVYDADVVVNKEPQWIQTAMAEPRTVLPWLVVSNGVSGYSGPLPDDVASTMAILKKYGGE